MLVILARPLLLLHPECHGVHGGHVLRLLEDMTVHVLLLLDLLKFIEERGEQLRDFFLPHNFFCMGCRWRRLKDGLVSCDVIYVFPH